MTLRNSQQERVLNDFDLWVSDQKLTFLEELEQVWERFKTTYFLKQLWSAWYPNATKTQASFCLFYSSKYLELNTEFLPVFPREYESSPLLTYHYNSINGNQKLTIVSSRRKSVLNKLYSWVILPRTNRKHKEHTNVKLMSFLTTTWR